jgi:phasin family protein
MQQTMAELADTMRTLATAEAPQAKAAKQAELLKLAYERAVTNTRELSDLIQRSNGEALSLLNHRFTEAMDEVKTLMSQANKAR